MIGGVPAAAGDYRNPRPPEAYTSPPRPKKKKKERKKPDHGPAVIVNISDEARRLMVDNSLSHVIIRHR